LRADSCIRRRFSFLDEPTLGLDPQSRNQLWTHVKKVNEAEKVTVMLTTHYMDEADRVAHRVGVIDHGKLVAQGTPARDQAADQHGDSGRRVPGADGLDDSRRERGIGRPDAAVCKDVARRQAMSAIYILWLRELKRYTRSRAQIVASLGQPMLYLLVLGFGLGPVFKRAGNGQLLPVCRARRDQHVGACSRRSFPGWACSGTGSSDS
jgi:ABC-type multidrug transport system ATPase subunit